MTRTAAEVVKTRRAAAREDMARERTVGGGVAPTRTAAHHRPILARQEAALDARPRMAGRPVLGDVVAGVSVALVLVPQAVAYAVLAGLPPRSGLVVAGVVTIAAAPFVAQPLLQTGPTAITSLLTLGSLAALTTNTAADPVALAALLALLVGLVRIAVAWRGAGEIAYLVSEPVLAAFTAAAGLVIALSQLPTILGVTVERDVGVAVEAGLAIAQVGSWSAQTIYLGLASIATVVLLGRIHPLIPSVLVTAVAGTMTVVVLEFDVPLVGELPSALPSLDLSLPWSAVPSLAVPALVIGLVGFSEASAIARSFASDAGERWDADREFLSQGAANVAAGLVGGMPVGASFSRSAVARTAGGATAWSGAVTGVVVLLSLPFVGLLADLPSAVLAGIIVAAVLSLLDPRPMLELRHYSRQQFSIAVLTYVLTVAFAPQIQWAVLIGVLLVVAAHLRRERKLAIESVRDGEVLHLHPVGLLHFGSVQRLEDQMRVLTADREGVERVVVHFDRVGRTDVSGALVLRRLLEELRACGMEVQVQDVTRTSRAIITRVLGEQESTAGVIEEDTADVGSPWRDTPFGTGPRG